MFWKREKETVFIHVPTLHPMGALTFGIACSHCKNRGKYEEFCHDCKCEIRSGFEYKTEKVNEPREVVHGRWETAFDNWCPHCSVCGEEPYRASNNDLPNFCPNCGADMRERKGYDAMD